MAGRSKLPHGARSCPTLVSPRLDPGTEGEAASWAGAAAWEGSPVRLLRSPRSRRKEIRAGQKDRVSHQSTDTGICWLIGTFGLLLLCDGQHNNLRSAQCAEFQSAFTRDSAGSYLGGPWFFPSASLHCRESGSLPSLPVMRSALWGDPTSM